MKNKNEIINLINTMDNYNAYPRGASPEKIAKQIIKCKSFNPNEKIEYVLDTYSNFFNKQLKSFVKFDVFEEHFESIIYKEGNKFYINNSEFDKYYEKTESIIKYISLRKIKDLVTEACKKKPDTNKIKPETKNVILKLSKLKNDYHERNQNNNFQNNIEENEIFENIKNRKLKENFIDDIFEL